MTTCPCGSKASFDECCGPLIAGRPAATAEALMRSRYSAFALGKIDHIQRTCAGEAALRFDRASLEADLRQTEWLDLTITEALAGQLGDDAGMVAFRARFRQGGRVQTLIEKSQFRRIGGEWYYVSGLPSLEADVIKKPGRNDPCSCGSGLKYKKCCGK